MAAISPRGKFVFANEAFLQVVGRDAGNVFDQPAAGVFGRALLQSLRKDPNVPRLWRLPDQPPQQVVGFKLNIGFGVVVKGQASGSPSPDTIHRVAELIDEMRRSAKGKQARMLDRIRGLLAAELPPSQARAPLDQLLADALHARSEQVRDVAITVTPARIPAFEVPAEAAGAVIGAALDHALHELAARATPRALRISVLSSRGGGIIRLTHNGSKLRSQRLQREAALWHIGVNVTTPGPRLGVTYSITLPTG
jgi:hypothetical protein